MASGGGDGPPPPAASPVSLYLPDPDCALRQQALALWGGCKGREDGAGDSPSSRKEETLARSPVTLGGSPPAGRSSFVGPRARALASPSQGLTLAGGVALTTLIHPHSSTHTPPQTQTLSHTHTSTAEAKPPTPSTVAPNTVDTGERRKQKLRNNTFYLHARMLPDGTLYQSVD